MNPPENDEYNPQRPPSYNLLQLPMRNEEDYWKIIKALGASHSKAQRAKITKDTGISRLPLCAASKAFVHPTFFPLDPFHLFYKNCMAYIWDLWTTITNPAETALHLPIDKARQFGEAVSAAMKTLPPAFCGTVRDPFLKRQSQYKVYEWMALLHWYVLPIGMELGFDPAVLENFLHFASAIEFSMTVASRSDLEIGDLHAKIRRVRLCIFQLIHVPIHMKWNGSIRTGSQATVERTIGEVGHKIRSKKAPFAHLANIITEKELLRILTIIYPVLSLDLCDNDNSGSRLDTAAGYPSVRKSQVVQHLAIRRCDVESTQDEFEAISKATNIYVAELREMSDRWGKARLTNGRLLRSKLSDSRSPNACSYRWFEARLESSQGTMKTTVFGEVIAFYTLEGPTKRSLAVYNPLTEVTQPLGQTRGKWDRSLLRIVDISLIVDIVGIWEAKDYVYILRKHPALAMLSAEELGNAEHDSGDSEEDSDMDDDH
ncbi:hypothetical protein B0H34DRAFT_828287 [Crassisporium funariophilum]|nr:hypothetical protein B0H34DRAFT_828287 [Crassisporium funariophilum]